MGGAVMQLSLNQLPKIAWYSPSAASAAGYWSSTAQKKHTFAQSRLWKRSSADMCANVFGMLKRWEITCVSLKVVWHLPFSFNGLTVSWQIVFSAQTCMRNAGRCKKHRGMCVGIGTAFCVVVHMWASVSVSVCFAWWKYSGSCTKQGDYFGYWPYMHHPELSFFSSSSPIIIIIMMMIGWGMSIASPLPS